MMTCFTPSVMRSDHVHFIDGARGGYASAATALKAMAAMICSCVVGIGKAQRGATIRSIDALRMVGAALATTKRSRAYRHHRASRSRRRRARRRSLRPAAYPGLPPRRCWHRCRRHRRCRSGPTICWGPTGLHAAENSGRPIIGRLFERRVRILVVDLGLAGGGIDRLLQARRSRRRSRRRIC